jgi:Fic family protein
MRDEFGLPDEAPGRYIPLRDDASYHRAYRPDPLPPTIEISGETLEELAGAMHELGRLDGIVGEVEDGSAVFASFLYKEAEQSSQVEGTRVTVSDILESQLEGEAETSDPDEESSHRLDVQEASNYVEALQEGIDYFDVAGRSRSSVTTELLKQLHGTLMEEGRTDEPDPLPGEFRDDIVHIREQNAGWKDPVRFVPPTPDVASSRMSDLETYIQNGGSYPDLVDCALVHYQFETIHPFTDGNGRLGRLLVALLLYASDILLSPVLYLSSYINRNREEYTDKLLAVSEAGEWEPWIRFFLSGLREQAREAFVRAKLLLEKRREYRRHYEDQRDSVNKLVRTLFEGPFLTIEEAADRIDMSYQTGRTVVEQLVDDGVLVRATEREWGAVYRAAEIMDILERDSQRLPDPDELITSSERGQPSI